MLYLKQQFILYREEHMKLLKSSNLTKICAAILALVLLNGITVLLGDTTSHLTVVNKTPYFLHITLNGTITPYVAPEGSAVMETMATPSIDVYVVFSPGQGMGNKSIDTTMSMPYSPPATTTSGYSCDCADDEYDCSTVKSKSTPAQGDSKVWEIKVTDFH
jgi:hypothetical protein